ncbi:hypothetical protein P2R64_30750 [Priestia megaterium]|uniref:hypothetical protein n=1 Tax=Priestia megaterium TaxID=1404 RepID=UPI0021C1FFC7|nr:hypothetical protein [Priestia megaterium]MCT9852281.1 hypothetical protein [Priestia megaterium]MDF1964426.1 hypothetical protein [Priestia megaterium]
MAFKKQLEDYRFNLRRKQSWKYTAILAFFFLGFLSLLTSKFYIHTDDRLYHTKMFEPISTAGTGNITLEERVYYPTAHALDMVVKIDQGEDENLSFSAMEKANPNVKLPVKVVYEDEGYYVVRVNNLSPHWEALAFDLYQKNEEKETVNVEDVTSDSETDSTEEIDAHALITTLYSDQRKTKSEEGKGTKNKQEYALLVNELEKDFVKKKMKNYEKEITVEAKHKRQTQQEMNELQRDMKYQVQEEKADTESKIAMEKDAIQSSDESIQLYKDEQKILQEKLKKLNEKEQDLVMK